MPIQDFHMNSSYVYHLYNIMYLQFLYTYPERDK